MSTPTTPDRDHPGPPTTGEIAALTARLRELSSRGRDVDPGERAAFPTDALTAPITAAQRDLDRRAPSERADEPHRPGRAEAERVARAGYRVQRWGDRGWLLRDTDGAELMIGSHGCVSPTKWEALAEAVDRIAQDERHAADLDTVGQQEPTCAAHEAGCAVEEGGVGHTHAAIHARGVGPVDPATLIDPWSMSTEEWAAPPASRDPAHEVPFSTRRDLNERWAAHMTDPDTRPAIAAALDRCGSGTDTAAPAAAPAAEDDHPPPGWCAQAHRPDPAEPAVTFGGSGYYRAAQGAALTAARDAGEAGLAERLQDRPWTAQTTTSATAHVAVPDDPISHTHVGPSRGRDTTAETGGDTDRGAPGEEPPGLVTADWMREHARRGQAEIAAQTDPPVRRDDPAEIAARLDALRYQIAATTDNPGDGTDAVGVEDDAARREQLTRCHHDDLTTATARGDGRDTTVDARFGYDDQPGWTQ